MPLLDVLSTASAESVALVDVGGHASWTFGELHERARCLAGLVGEHGDAGATVALVGPNDPAWIDAYYGVPAAGMVASFVNHRLSTAQIVAALRRAEPGLVLAAEGIDTGDLPTVRFGAEYEAMLARATPAPTREVPDADDERRAGDAAVAWHIPTSGTSGTAKIVQLTHASILAAVRSAHAVRPVVGDEVYLFPFPLCHVAGYNVVTYHRLGRPVVLVDRFDAAAVLDAIDTHRVTHISLAPTMLVTLLEHLASTGRAAPTSLRCVTYGSAAIERSLLERSMHTLGCGFSQGYGMTELSGNAVFLSPADHRAGLSDRPHLLAAAGRPAPEVRVCLLDDDGRDLGDGPGEIAVRAPQVMAGYLDAGANAATFVDGWMRTGDVGRLDEDGYLYVIDRKKDIIISGGENISSREVEDALSRHPGVAEVAVVGLPDATWGEIVCAVVVRRDPAVGVDELLDYGRATIGGYKKPRRIEFVDALPRTASGKVVKADVRRAVLDRLRSEADG